MENIQEMSFLEIKEELDKVKKLEEEKEELQKKLENLEKEKGINIPENEFKKILTALKKSRDCLNNLIELGLASEEVKKEDKKEETQHSILDDLQF